MLDYVIRSGTVIDGTGEPGRLADVGIRDGRIVAIGQIDEPATTEFDAGGLIVMPGVVDPHTHYDAQLFWDPLASPSNVHGVTTVIGGNCGFTLAPINAEDADYIRQMMAKVEGMPLAALENGVPWNWSTLRRVPRRARRPARRQRRVPGRPLRPAPQGHGGRARRGGGRPTTRSPPCAPCLAESLAAGGLGFSSSQSRTHSDGDGRPISSRYADRREMLAFCEEVAAHEGTTLEYITNGCLDSFTDEEVDLMTAMSVTAQRPAQLERPDRRRPLGRADRAPAVRLVRRGRRRRADRRPDHAHARPHEHELPHPLRALPHSGLGRRHGPARGRAHAAAGRSRRARPARRAGPQQGGGRLPRAWPAGAPTSSATPTRRPTRAARSAPWPTSRPSGAPRPSTRCSTSSWPTTCAPCCGPTPTTATRPPGTCGPRSGATRAPWSAAPTPARTSTACAARTTRPPSSATACAAASSSRWRRPCT